MNDFFKNSCFSFLLIIFCAPIAAQDMKDTLLIEEVIIYVRKAETFAVGTRITSIDTSQLYINNSSSLADILQFNTPLYMKSYGNGMLATPSFRGTAATHTAVLWNGFNINYSTLGLSDFSIIPASSINSVEVQHGSSSGNYGSGAIGGAILLSSIPNWDNKLNVKLQHDLGSFGRSYSSGYVGLGNKRIQSSTHVYYNTAINDFKFHNIFKLGKPVERQVNSEIEQYGIVQDLYWKPIDKLYVSLKGWYNFSDRNIQPSMGASNTHDVQKDQNIRLMAEVSYTSAAGATIGRTAYFDDVISFTNDYLSSDSKVKTYQGQLEHELALKNNKIRFRAGLEIQHFDAFVDGYGKNVSENRGSGFLLLRYDPFKRLNLSINLRQALVQKYNPPLTPSFGLNFALIEKKLFTTNLKASISKSYRVPTLNERYWNPGGNPDIMPESGFNYEASVLHKFYLKKITWETELGYFDMLVDNWIQWRPVSTGSYWAPINISQVHSQGVEASSKISYREKNLTVSIGTIYAFTSSVNNKKASAGDRSFQKQLIYVPLHNASAYADLSYKKWLLLYNFSFIGYRYITADNDYFLPGYGLMNCAFGRSIQIRNYRFDVIGKVNNIFNVIYQNMQNRATPLRNYSVSVRLNFNK